ncbi:MAG: extracellular solute-binding protein [Planctomycetaceae bacterium]|nr:extracellular solute-binding protein [Planctomycetaceae bacterium]
MQVRPASVFILLGYCLVCALHAGAVELTLSVTESNTESIRTVVEDWESITGNRVRIIATDNSSTVTMDRIRTELRSGENRADLYMVDVAWTGLIQEHLADLRPYASGMEKMHLPAAIEAYTYRDRLVALPLFLDAGVMFFRMDLLAKHGVPIPFTWQGLTSAAEKVMRAEREAGNPNLWGYIFQGQPYEGLTCNALEWIFSRNGGTIMEHDGTVTINNPEAVEALAEAASWIGRISPEEVLTFAEEESIAAFQAGNAVFMRNWPFAWNRLQADDSPVKGKVGSMPVPRGSPAGRSPGTMGGWAIAVADASPHRAVAAELALYLTGPLGQKKFCIVDTHIPSIEALFKDQEVIARVPMAVLEIFMSTVSRPTAAAGNKYDHVSRIFFTGVHSVLSGAENPKRRSPTSKQRWSGSAGTAGNKSGKNAWHPEYGVATTPGGDSCTSDGKSFIAGGQT